MAVRRRDGAPTAELAQMKILAVDDEPAARLLFKGILTRAGYQHVYTSDDPFSVEEEFQKLNPDLLVLDNHMPGRGGLQVLRGMQGLLPEGFPVLMITGDDRQSVREEALAGGATDFLPKPINPIETRLRIRNMLENRRLHLALSAHNDQLEVAVKRRTFELEMSQLEILVRLARAAEYRDDETGQHTWRVAHVSGAIGQELALPAQHVQLLIQTARLHDVGKIAIPYAILLKEDALTEEEFEVVKGHTRFGAELLSGSRSPLIQLAELIALSHHEHWDGSGYPDGLKGEAIPIEARIVAVADAFDALTNDRTYRKAVGVEEAVAEIARRSGSQFDPQVVAGFLAAHKNGGLQVPDENEVS